MAEFSKSEGLKSDLIDPEDSKGISEAPISLRPNCLSASFSCASSQVQDLDQNRTEDLGNPNRKRPLSRSEEVTQSFLHSQRLNQVKKG